MGLEKLIKQLGHMLDEPGKNKKADCESIEDLLDKLKKKKNKLEKEIKKEDRASKRKKLKLELKITSAELKKGQKLRSKRCK